LLHVSYLFHRTEILREGMERLAGWVEEGRVQAPSVRTFPLERADASRLVETPAPAACDKAARLRRLMAGPRAWS